MLVDVCSIVKDYFATGAFVVKFDIFLMSAFVEFEGFVKLNQGVTTFMENKLGNVNFMFSARSSIHESQCPVSRSAHWDETQLHWYISNLYEERKKTPNSST